MSPLARITATLLVALAACGGGGATEPSPTTPTTPPVSVSPTPDLREQARSAFCAEVNDLGNLVLTSTDVGQEVEDRLSLFAMDILDEADDFEEAGDTEAAEAVRNAIALAEAEADGFAEAHPNAQDAFDAFRRFVDALIDGLPAGLCPELG